MQSAVTGTTRVLDAALATGVKQIIITVSMVLYRLPRQTTYGRK